MTRTAAPYAARAVQEAAAQGQDVSQPEAGYFRFRLRSGGVACGVRIHHGPPLDPVTGEVLDRSWRWQADVNGEPFGDFDRVWPGCTGEPISERQYAEYVMRHVWARDHAPDSAFADPSRKRDALSRSEPLPF